MMSWKYSQFISRYDFHVWIVEDEDKSQNCQFHGKDLNLVPLDYESGTLCLWKGKWVLHFK
jgi:hypothetical protein